jgi:hypothetical protein
MRIHLVGHFNQQGIAAAIELSDDCPGFLPSREFDINEAFSLQFMTWPFNEPVRSKRTLYPSIS